MQHKLASSGRKQLCADFPEAQLKLEAKAPMSGTPKIDPEIGKIDGGESCSLMHIIGRVITYQYTRMIYIDIFRFYIYIYICYLWMWYIWGLISLLLHYLCINIYSYISQQLTILEKDPWVPAPESLCFLVSDILWSWVLRNCKDKFNKGIESIRIKSRRIVFSPLFCSPYPAMGENHQYFTTIWENILYKHVIQIQVYSGPWSIP